MKTKFILIVFLFIASYAFCQRDLVDRVTGAPIKEKRPDIEGSPYWTDEWHKGTITAKSGRVSKDILVRYNVLDNKIEFKEDEKIFETTEPVTEFTIENVEMSKKEGDEIIETNIFVFKNSFSSKSNIFYCVIYDGKTKLLEARDKRIEDVIPYGQPPGKKIINETSYYLYKGAGELTKIRRTKSGLLKSLAPKEKEVDLYITSNKLNIDKDTDLIKVMKYYDTITSN